VSNPFVECKKCAARLSECPTDAHGNPVIRVVFDVDGTSGSDGGHVMVRTPEGAVPLCTANRLRQG
jgi:hypothetical protein